MTANPVLDAAIRHTAWLLWCYEQGYWKAEDRAILTNWFEDDAPDTLTADDAEVRRELLAMAAEIVTAVRGELGEWDMAPGHG